MKTEIEKETELKKVLKETITQSYEQIDWKKLSQLGFKLNGLPKTKRTICDFLIKKGWD
ncbi:MAG: hypothetical protein WCI51_02240 [Lentisphaerota bacterium]